MIGKLSILGKKKKKRKIINEVSTHIQGFVFLGHEIFGVGHLPTLLNL